MGDGSPRLQALRGAFAVDARAERRNWEGWRAKGALRVPEEGHSIAVLGA